MADGSHILEGMIREGLAERKAIIDACPAKKTFLGDKPCPKCHAGFPGPCWENVRADAAFIDLVKELAPLHPSAGGSNGRD